LRPRTGHAAAVIALRLGGRRFADRVRGWIR